METSKAKRVGFGPLKSFKLYKLTYHSKQRATRCLYQSTKFAINAVFQSACAGFCLDSQPSFDI